MTPSIENPKQEAVRVRQRGEGWPDESPVLAQRAPSEGMGKERPGALLARRARNKNVLARCAQ